MVGCHLEVLLLQPGTCNPLVDFFEGPARFMGQALNNPFRACKAGEASLIFNNDGRAEM